MNAKGILFFIDEVIKGDQLFVRVFNANTDEQDGEYSYKGKVERIYHDRVTLRVPDGNRVKEVTVSYDDIISYEKVLN
ncbi:MULTISPECIES: hypothetical protein [Bacillus]|nr:MULTISPECIES: hypothetical protein [Bacillus]MEC0341936.1 hypothetical protein [Bacillus sonorensis]MEC0487894.1 hypothetical protein [Bacillus glycinifermentans]MEC0530655.1 hypothetical protein [Bacillus sonorensis]UBF35267.1 hypothetical protein K9N56_24075 [Bacillus sp. PM8313]